MSNENHICSGHCLSCTKTPLGDGISAALGIDNEQPGNYPGCAETGEATIPGVSPCANPRGPVLPVVII